VPLQALDGEWKLFVGDVQTFRTQVESSRKALLRLRKEPQARQQLSELWKAGLEKDESVEQFAVRALALTAPKESERFETLLSSLLGEGKSLLSMQRVETLRQNCLAAELVRRVLSSSALRLVLVDALPAFWKEACEKGHSVQTFWLKALALVVPDSKERAFFEEGNAAVKGILGKWEFFLEWQVGDIDGTPQFQQFTNALGGSEVMQVVAKEPLVVPFLLLLLFPPVAVALLFLAPLLFPVLLVNTLKIATFTSSAAWKEGLEKGATLKDLVQRAMAMHPDRCSACAEKRRTQKSPRRRN